MPANGLFGFPGYGNPDDKLYDYQVFTSSGTWVKPANAKWVQVYACGPGGGGGGGRKGADLTNRYGSSGGYGGGSIYWETEASVLPYNVPVTISAGGAGAAATTTNDTNGSGGSQGGLTTFGSYLTGRPGFYSNGGSSTSGGGSGGSTSDYTMFSGFTGTTGVAANTPSDYPFTISTGLSSPGGGGGCGISSSNAVGVINPANVSGLYCDLFDLPVLKGIAGLGGQGSKTAGVNTSAGNGTYGGGGGGGGGGTNDIVDGGAGGNGGDGYVIVRTILKKAPLDVQMFTTDGTWRKPSDKRLTRVRVIAVGGGGGGSSGARSATGTNSSGGGGGGGAGTFFGNFALSTLPQTVSVSVGIGGTGGVALDATSPVSGNAGNTSSFGTYLTTVGGKGGLGSTGGTFTRANLTGDVGANGSGTSTGSSYAFTGSGYGLCGGGGGAGVNSVETRANGGSSTPGNGYNTSIWAITAGGTTTTINGSNAADPFPGKLGWYAPAGGGGGASANNVNTVAGNGGNGIYGSGGGGGGGGRNGGSGGDGGNGGDGLVLVICY